MSAGRPAHRLVDAAHRMHEAGLSHGSTGNVSVRLDDRSILVTATGSRLASVAVEDLATIGLDGRHIAGPTPTKEAFLHAALLRARPQATAVAHSHSIHAAAWSCRADLDPGDAVPALTAYFAMRVGRVRLLPYHAPGDEALGEIAFSIARETHAILLANHGPIVAGVDLDSAVESLEELEQTARLALLLDGLPVRPLSTAERTALHRHPSADAPDSRDPHREGQTP